MTKLSCSLVYLGLNDKNTWGEIHNTTLSITISHQQQRSIIAGNRNITAEQKAMSVKCTVSKATITYLFMNQNFSEKIPHV